MSRQSLALACKLAAEHHCTMEHIMEHMAITHTTAFKYFGAPTGMYYDKSLMNMAKWVRNIWEYIKMKTSKCIRKSLGQDERMQRHPKISGKRSCQGEI